MPASGFSQLCSRLANDFGLDRPQIVSPPQLGDDQFSTRCYVLALNNFYEVYWDDPSSYPDLSRFPCITGGKICHLKTSSAITQRLRKARIVGFGQHAIVVSNLFGFWPITKIAHPNALARTLLGYEFEMLRELSEHSLSVPKHHPRPLSDEQGIFGYRMERLYKLDYSNLGLYRTEVKKVMDEWHAKGFCHGDLHPSNVMLTRRKQVVFIDPSFAGRSGGIVPPDIFGHHDSGHFFRPDADQIRLDHLFR